MAFSFILSLTPSRGACSPMNHRFLDAKANELDRNILSFIPRVDRQQYVDRLLQDHRKEAQLHDVVGRPEAAAHRWARQHHVAAQTQPGALHPNRLNDGMKTALSGTPNPCFSLPSSFGTANDTLLQKQRKLERLALRQASDRLDGARRVATRSPVTSARPAAFASMDYRGPSESYLTGRKLPW